MLYSLYPCGNSGRQRVMSERFHLLPKYDPCYHTMYMYLCAAGWGPWAEGVWRRWVGRCRGGGVFTDNPASGWSEQGGWWAGTGVMALGEARAWETVERLPQETRRYLCRDEEKPGQVEGGRRGHRQGLYGLVLLNQSINQLIDLSPSLSICLSVFPLSIGHIWFTWHNGKQNNYCTNYITSGY